MIKNNDVHISSSIVPSPSFSTPQSQSVTSQLTLKLNANDCLACQSSVHLLQSSPTYPPQSSTTFLSVINDYHLHQSMLVLSTNSPSSNILSIQRYICITETWLIDLIYDKEILPNKFTLYCKDRESRGGGVLIAVNDLLPSILFCLLLTWKLYPLNSASLVLKFVFIFQMSNTSLLFDNLLLLIKSSLSSLGTLICLISAGSLLQVIFYSVTL